MGYIAYALYKIEKNTELQNYTTAHPKATDIDIQNKKNYFRYSRCNEDQIKRYWNDAKRIDNDMYGKKLKNFIAGFENGAQGERAHLKDDFEGLLSKKVNEAIDGKIDEKYNLEKKHNYWRGVSQSLIGTVIWIVITIIAGLYLAFGNQTSNPNKTNVKQTVTETVSKTIYSAK